MCIFAQLQLYIRVEEYCDEECRLAVKFSYCRIVKRNVNANKNVGQSIMLKLMNRSFGNQKSDLLILVIFIHRNSRMVGFLIIVILTSKENLKDLLPFYFISHEKVNKINERLLIYKNGNFAVKDNYAF